MNISGSSGVTASWVFLPSFRDVISWEGDAAEFLKHYWRRRICFKEIDSGLIPSFVFFLSFFNYLVSVYLLCNFCNMFH